ncbi:TetR/AcrR family transcriptional regulator [Nocardiopsis sp. MG754419]|uniref:TetR/AcrR family transcriptional regulator n=1 Tax=Nocardiopsis sp. MG754419 TaxID=2259865 RepID=UPI001BA45264|nr:TetR/AcrR family transcriptional regulator [Nocardiopsis sp. MG754419]MBR8742688.1 TetR family transcriptional regulator [Nocardiopsis sp. MG754419]
MNHRTALDPETLTPSARRILITAAALFYDNGIAAVGVDRIAADSGVTKRTLYNRFGSKETLVATYLLERDRRWRALVERRVHRSARATERLLAPFEALGEWTVQHPRGCAFVNALAELPDPAHPAHRVIIEEKQWLRALFEQAAEEAGAERPDLLAARLYFVHEGALTAQATAPDLDAVEIATDLAHLLVRTAV